MSASSPIIGSVPPRNTSLDQSATHNRTASGSSASRRTPLDHETFLKYGSSGQAGSDLSDPTVTKFNCAPTERNSRGHNADYAKFDLNGKNVIHHENIYLKPVYKTTVRHIEIEEVERVTTIDRHIHHIQYHQQGVVSPNPVAINDRHSYYELVDPRLNITQSEPIFHAPVEHKLKYQPVSREEFLESGSAIRPGSEMDHFEEHVSIGGIPRPLREGQTQAGLTSQYVSNYPRGQTSTSTSASGQQQYLQQPETSQSASARSSTVGRAV